MFLNLTFPLFFPKFYNHVVTRNMNDTRKPQPEDTPELEATSPTPLEGTSAASDVCISKGKEFLLRLGIPRDSLMRVNPQSLERLGNEVIDVITLARLLVTEVQTDNPNLPASDIGRVIHDMIMGVDKPPFK